MTATQLKHKPNRRHYPPEFRLYSTVMVFFIFAWPFLASNAAFPFPRSAEAIVVVDPGHGGVDTGGRGRAGALEKNIALTLSSLIANQLNRKNDINAFLTRNDDYSLPIFDRTSKANQLDADAFISIHVGGGFGGREDSVSVFYNTRPPELEMSLQSDIQGMDSFNEWSSIQFFHLKQSRKMARIIEKELVRNPMRLKTVHIKEAPLAVLEGADMPAVLIEIGCIGNPLHEEWLKDHDFLSELAVKIATAVYTFLSAP